MLKTIERVGRGRKFARLSCYASTPQKKVWSVCKSVCLRFSSTYYTMVHVQCRSFSPFRGKVMILLRELDPFGSQLRKKHRLRRRKYHSKVIVLLTRSSHETHHVYIII